MVILNLLYGILFWEISLSLTGRKYNQSFKLFIFIINIVEYDKHLRLWLFILAKKIEDNLLGENFFFFFAKLLLMKTIHTAMVLHNH